MAHSIDEVYPTDEQLKKIAEWPWDYGEGWFDFIESIWYLRAFGWHIETGGPVWHYFVSTGGWSGNEDIIRAMQKNEMLWSFHWVQSRRGGHYIFELRQNPMVDLDHIREDTKKI